MINIPHHYQLDECLKWILDNKFTKIALQLKQEDLRHSLGITKYLNDKAKELLKSEDEEPLNLFVTQTKTCCVDLLVTQHVTDLEAVVHFGRVCFSKPYIEGQQPELPILFALGHPHLNNDFSKNFKSILDNIESIRAKDESCRLCILYDTNLADYAQKLEEHFRMNNLRERVDIARLHNPSDFWNVTSAHETLFIKKEQIKNLFGFYSLENPIDYYNCAIYIGTRNSIHLTLAGPARQYRINFPDETHLETLNITKILSRRMALVGRLKEEMELSVGVIITNPLPDLQATIQRLKSYAESRKHTLYFISMIQTIDECKIGNFDLCDAFVVINSCTCSTILESLVFNRPIITEHEFKLACGIEAEYGRVLWPGSSSHLTTDDMINKRKVSDVSLALIHTRNELLERCSQARSNKWSGLEFKASSGSDGGDGKESLEVTMGLQGIASSYVSEPLKKCNSDKQEKFPDCSINAVVSNQNVDSNKD